MTEDRSYTKGERQNRYAGHIDLLKRRQQATP